MSEKGNFKLNSAVEIEVIATKNGKHYKKIMTMHDWESLKREPGWYYKAYQRGFSQFKTEN